MYGLEIGQQQHRIFSNTAMAYVEVTHVQPWITGLPHISLWQVYKLQFDIPLNLHASKAQKVAHIT